MQGTPLPPNELREILFRVNGKCGYPLDGALKKQYTGLDGRDDKAFDNPGPTADIRLEVCSSASARSDENIESLSQWLPYPGWGAQVGTDPFI